jgi:hypothetical protein
MTLDKKGKFAFRTLGEGYFRLFATDVQGNNWSQHLELGMSNIVPYVSAEPHSGSTTISTASKTIVSSEAEKRVRRPPLVVANGQSSSFHNGAGSE